eukprot:14427441-Alexandrium_andersonii.AAC.1
MAFSPTEGALTPTVSRCLVSHATASSTSGSAAEWGLCPSQMACQPRLAAALAPGSASIASAMRPRTSSTWTPLHRSLSYSSHLGWY